MTDEFCHVKGASMMSTTSYGSFATLMGRGRTIAEYVKDCLDDPSGYHYTADMVAAIIEEFRGVLSTTLPPGVTLDGEEIAGPPIAGADFRTHGYRVHENGELDFLGILYSIPLGRLSRLHRTTVTLFEAANGELVIDNEYDLWAVPLDGRTHMQGRFAVDAEAWAAGVEPNEDDGYTLAEVDDDRTAVAEWTATGGVRQLVGADQLGAAACHYLGKGGAD